MINDKHHRRSIRLKGYDYSQPGAYFVTMCVACRECLLGDIGEGVMRLSPYGAIVQECWYELPRHFADVELDTFVAMPNHVHGMVVLRPVGAGFKPAPTKHHPLSEIVRGFKTFSARRINEHRGTPGIPVWQRNYYERVIRNEGELDRIREYVANNPMRWPMDRENPDHVGAGFKPAPTDDIDAIFGGVGL